MNIYVGADHGGVELKKAVKKILEGRGHQVVDVGALEYDKNDDFPAFGKAVAEKVSEDPVNRRGILLCRSGIGMDMVANKFKNVLSVLAISPEQVARGRHDEDVNVLCIAGDFTKEEDVAKMVDAFLNTPYANEERYTRRLKQIAEIEKELYK